MQRDMEATASRIHNLGDPVVANEEEEPTLPQDSESLIPDHPLPIFPILIPLLGKPKSFGFASAGGTFSLKEHNVTVAVPSGAVTKPTEVQMGVLLSGPFKFPSNSTLVSPILWLGVRSKKTMKFSRAIEASLPHFIDCSCPGEISNLAFVKATHDTSFSDRPFVFTEVSVDQTSFTGSKGSVYLKQCCFVCIIHKDPKKVLEKTKFCLVSTVPRPVDARLELNFCVVHSLRTCIEVSTTCKIMSFLHIQNYVKYICC